MGSFCAGIAFILAATVLNIAHDNIAGFELETLPFYVGTLYATMGKVGVTLLLVTIGMVCLLLGARVSMNQPRAANSALAPGSASGLGSTYLNTARPSSSTPSLTGRVSLETWKYVAPVGETGAAM